MDDDLETSLEGFQDEYEGNKDAARALMRVKQKLDGYEDGEMRSMHGQMEDMERLQLCLCLHEKNMVVSCYLFPEEFLLPKDEGGNRNRNSQEKCIESSFGAPIPTLSLDALPLALASLPPAYLFSAPPGDVIPFPSPSPYLSHHSSFVTSGSTIYGLGGFSENNALPIHDVFAYTTDSLSKHDWIQLPSMLVGRVRPVTAVLDQKLYVFGSSWKMASHEPWAEVFDMVSQQWSPLPELDTLGDEVSWETLALVWQEHNSIVLLDGGKGRGGSLFLYEPKRHSWTFLDFIALGVTFDFNCHRGAVLVDGWIYYSIDNYIYAYNIIDRVGVATIIHGFPIVEYLKDATLIHLGGEHFCMLCLAFDCIHYVRFHASISTEGEMTSYVEFCESYYVADQYLDFLAAALLSNPRRDMLNRVYASDDDRVYAMERAQQIQSKFPSFLMPVLQLHVTGGFWLGLPVEFCKTHLPDKDEVLSLVDENGKKFSTKYLAGKTGLSGGWRRFAIDHQLVVGDVLVCQLVKPTEFKVSIVRATMKRPTMKRRSQMSHYVLEQAESSL